MFTELDMQDIVEKAPHKFFHKGVRVYQRESWLGQKNRIDFLLEDTINNKFILLEMMRGYLGT